MKENNFMAAPHARVRNTTATRKRNENMRFLIGELRVGKMTALEIGAFLKMSPSGARKYIRDLMDAGVIWIGSTQPGKTEFHPTPIYHLKRDEENIEKFMKSTEQSELPPSSYSQKQPPKPLPAGVHTMGDDTYFRVRRAAQSIPKPDPLLAALFGK